MAQGNNEKIQVLLVGTTFFGTASTDLTTNLLRRTNQLTGTLEARVKAVILAAGGA